MTDKLDWYIYGFQDDNWKHKKTWKTTNVNAGFYVIEETQLGYYYGWYFSCLNDMTHMAMPDRIFFGITESFEAMADRCLEVATLHKLGKFSDAELKAAEDDYLKNAARIQR